MMRAIALTVVLTFVLAVSSSALAQDDVRDPGKVNKILTYGTFVTPDLEPGQQGLLAFNFSNPYSVTNMTNVRLNVSIYAYAEQDVYMTVDSSWSWQYPRFAEAPSPGRNITITYPILRMGESIRVNLTVLTSTDMPHGGVFNQGSYFIRFWLDFDFNGTPAKMASPGYWTKEQLQYATAEGPNCQSADCVGQVNLSRLGNIDGILPDTGFGVKDLIPTWPFYAMIAGASFFIVLAFLFYAEENPSQFPRTARMFATFKGKLARVFRPRKSKKARGS